VRFYPISLRFSQFHLNPFYSSSFLFFSFFPFHQRLASLSHSQISNFPSRLTSLSNHTVFNIDVGEQSDWRTTTSAGLHLRQWIHPH